MKRILLTGFYLRLVLVYMVKPMLTVHSVLDSAQLIYQWLLDELLFDQVILLERF